MLIQLPIMSMMNKTESFFMVKLMNVKDKFEVVGRKTNDTSSNF